MADTKISALTALVAGDIQHTSDVVAIVDTSVTTTKKATAQAVVNAVLAQNTDTTVTGTINQTTIPTSKTLLVSTDIGSTVQGYDATTLKSANIGVTVQGYDAQLADVAGLAVTDGNFIVGNGTNFVAESGSTARTSLGLGTGDSPEFTAVNIGNATDTTVTRVSAGVIAVEGSNVLLASNIGTTVQGYDADTAKLDVAQTFTAAQTFNNPTVFSAGTASLPSITFTGDTNTGIFSPAADTIAFAEGGVESMRIDSNGNVGIGTTSPNIGSANADNAILTLKGKASTRGSIFELANFGTTANDQTLGWNRYFDGSTENASIEVARASSTSTAYIKFSTNGGSGSTERARITSGGDLLVGTTAFGNVNANAMAFSPSSKYMALSHASGTSSGSGYISFGLSTSEIGSITQNGTTAVAYNTTSDYRLKENVQPMQNALAKVAQLNPVTYTWKVDGSAGQGFIAHELQAVCPDAVTGEKDATKIQNFEVSPAVPATYDEDGNELTPAVEAVYEQREVPKYQGVDTSFLVATLTAAIQELKAELDATKAEVAALEAK